MIVYARSTSKSVALSSVWAFGSAHKRSGHNIALDKSVHKPLVDFKVSCAYIFVKVPTDDPMKKKPALLGLFPADK